jgi:integrase
MRFSAICRALLARFKPEHYVFAHEKYGLAGNNRHPCAWEIDPTHPMHRWKVAWESARKAAKVSCRFHDLRHTFISRLAESQASDSTVMALAGHVSRAMMERYSHIRMEAKRRGEHVGKPQVGARQVSQSPKHDARA